MPERANAVAQDVARTVHELNVLVHRLRAYQRDLPHLVAAELNDVTKAVAVLLTIINAAREELQRNEK